MATLNPAAVQNENIHMFRGKGFEGAKLGAVQNENIHIHKGKGIEVFKAEKTKPLKRHERKALGDLSHAGKPLSSTSTINKDPALKEKSFANKRIGLAEKSTIREKSTAKKAIRRNILTDEEIAQCEKWAKEGIEHMPSSANDMHKLEENRYEERVKRKVDKASSALRVWNDVTFGLNFPQDVPSDDEEPIHLKFEPEFLPSTWRTELSPKLDYEDVDDILGIDDAEYESLFFDRQYDLSELKLKDEYESDSGILQTETS